MDRFFKGTATPEVDFLDRVFGIQSIAVGDLILAEVLQGFRSDRDFTTAKSILAVFE